MKEVVEKAEAMFAERRAAAEAENGAQGSGAAGNDAQGAAAQNGAAQGGAAAEAGSAAQTGESADGSVIDIEAKPEITYEDFAKMQFQVGEIIACEEVKKSKKLLCSQVKIGSQVKQIVSGIKAHYTAQEMVGKKVMVLVNLKPAKLAGVLSEGMLLCARTRMEIWPLWFRKRKCPRERRSADPQECCGTGRRQTGLPAPSCLRASG